jgi:hypothetical protein
MYILTKLYLGQTIVKAWVTYTNIKDSFFEKKLMTARKVPTALVDG